MTARRIAAERVLPVFTGEWWEEQVDHWYGWSPYKERPSWGEFIIQAINTRIAAKGFRLGDAPKRDNEYDEGYACALANTQARINAALEKQAESYNEHIEAAVLAEREACAEIIRHMSVPPGLMATEILRDAASAIRARTTKTEIATDGATGFSDPPSGVASLPGTEGDADLEPLDEKLRRQIIDAFPQLCGFNDAPGGMSSNEKNRRDDPV